ncbi:Uncharacterized membrane protein [Filimonas lacunae]|uniref:Uncharacterized membrane protein n=1 Tax=Filimonas lacunae TaxID=477680 RepID=A0A173MCW4_9BACT|nr:DUF1622 domain-containing protein [Filimonas lacunae]BAV05424.1 hypothetical protein FLA_1431 [Filimonas lacunae]SIT21234.1 Uncharacterized membrane protein [Filimonas lacunae]
MDLFIHNLVHWLRFALEIMGALAIAVGTGMSLYQFIQAWFNRKHTDFNQVRLLFARYLALALEFQLGADILSTAIAPNWEEIGKLGAIAIIRTGLNYFLFKEINEQQKPEDKEVQPKN